MNESSYYHSTHGICFILTLYTTKEQENVLKKFNAKARILWISNILDK